MESADMQVKNAVLWHLEDRTDKKIRKGKYLAEANQWLSGVPEPPVVHVPDDGDILTL